MARQRLTTRRLTATPDAFSGRNFNSPVMLYDTHPNKRFIVGEDVIPVTGAMRGMPVRGQVLGHCAEDRIWVKWPTEIAQEDVSDVMALREYEYGGSTQARLKGPQAGRAAARRAMVPAIENQGSPNVQELAFDTLPGEQTPEKAIDLEPENSGEVTIIDMGSMYNDGYDQTGVIEQALQESDLDSWGSEINDPF